MNPTDQARRYLEKCEPAISGQNGHGQTFSVACILVQEFGLSVEEARPLMDEFSARCQPRWTSREIEHKLRDAEKAKTPAQGRGFRVTSKPIAMPRRITVVDRRPEKKYTAAPDTKLPEPMKDGARELLRAAFLPGEGVRIAQARTNDEGKEVPKDAGLTLSREEWLRKLDAKDGDINKIFSTSDKNGVYVTLNPMKIGGSKDQDVIAFRHALVEWDNITPEEQWTQITQSRIPVTAAIYSGGDSIHAWVRVDAKDRTEFDARVAVLYAHFGGLDDKNKNPSRLSRLPACERGKKRQELLALNIGAESWTQWAREQETADLPPGHTIQELCSVDTSHDPGCVIGFRDGKTLRYLCREKSAWIIGPSGIGKSTLATEFAIGWALGVPVFGITPAKPLKVLIIQAENDKFDLAEMVQGVIRAHKLDPDFDPTFDSLNERIVLQSEDTAVGLKFIDRLHRYLDRDKADVVFVDPLLSFAGIDVSKQDQVSHFLREGINPVLKATGAVMIGMHHTGKLKVARKELEMLTPIEFAYLGLGSSELVNWARAVMTLIPIENSAFRLELAKRGPRAGARHPDGMDARSTVFLQHSKQGGIRWEQIQPPGFKDDGDNKGGRPDRCVQIAGMNLHDVLSKIPEGGESARKLAKRLAGWSRSNSVSISDSAARNRLLDMLNERGKIQFDEAVEKYKRGKNA